MACHHIVVQGECMESIARKHGFSDSNMIWNHPENTALRTHRTSMHVLAPGDVVFIPDQRMKVAQGSTDKIHRFKVRLPKRDVNIVLLDADDQPIADSPYVLRVGAEVRKGKTRSDGGIHEKGFHPALDRGELELPQLGITRTLLIGHLDPHKNDSGWRQRLINLGYEGNEEGMAQYLRDRGHHPEDTDEETAHNALYSHSKS